ncbi:hypothetical protein J007_02228 [Cryptococcus neoformans]|nr:hypothetical protein J007_02228 [Cryptococcus neoformans var. grubii]OXC62317.1 hypothetical protein C358_02298 [Cryptococcus neoformans var. grubii MW-RSA852]
MAEGDASQNTSRKRSSRACDSCKIRRSKCEDIREIPGVGPICKACREESQECLYTLPVRKRGPARGFKNHINQNSQNAEGSQRSQAQPSGFSGSSSYHEQNRATQGNSGTHSPVAGSSNQSHIPLRQGEPFFGIPTNMVDRLLAVYFTHVHNVWPLICKPVFNPHHTSAHLLLSMLAVAVCVAPETAVDGFNSETLFAMAERALLQRRMEVRIDIIQSFVLMSLRQTGCGDKKSAAVYANRASTMAFTMGLHLDPGTPPPGSGHAKTALAYEHDTRARVYWNCYVLDKVIAEETGRPFILPYRRSSIPFPSINEVDELEAWPPLPMSSAPLPQSVRHVNPKRGYVMSCFVWTCRMAMLVEEILDLEMEGPNLQRSSEWWDRQFSEEAGQRRHLGQERERIAKQLSLWKQSLPSWLDVNTKSEASPLPHHVVGVTWYHTSRILLYSRFLRRHPVASSPIAGEDDTRAFHAICSDAAQAVVDLLSMLDKHRLLQQVSSDIIHLLSLTTLFEAYDSVSSDPALANRAKINFSQCCLWLREFSSSWASASAHRVFFEGLIRGGLHLSSPEDNQQGTEDQNAGQIEPPPFIEDGLRAVQQQFASNATQQTYTIPTLMENPTDLAPVNLFQLPQYYWNHLSVNDSDAIQFPDPLTPERDSINLQFIQSSEPNHPPATSPIIQLNHLPSDSATSVSANKNVRVRWDPRPSGETRPAGVIESMKDVRVEGEHFVNSMGGVDQNAIYSALMTYMVDAIKGGS